ncbi:TlpA family protein disulfide reductase [Mucilaginibacter myungsuensis]|uniref:TlpA family protein disulfide reductase n=1 Tax=Mucilaginibacter myungsuensis TaxID=649104 RepID=A0A929KVD8_9SPHI|nr:TlpA disulfide reductase family protein [Mucilaginibacter myungsuensis]MBE9661150.1 TlpA family protein disulfide reductase [Mucilaginibacter myungsuensis]MDN3597295.1 TlpA disulfide reductase family protein [Mucilaginibacter myungsuensis]
MKNIYLTLILAIGALGTSAQQLVLKGHVKVLPINDSIEVNTSYDGYHWKKGSIYLKANAAGNFSKILPYKQARFVQLIYGKSTQYMLLTPGRDVQVSIAVDAGSAQFNFTGKGKPENDLLKKLKLEEEANLPFVKELKSKYSYANWSIDSVISIKLPLIKRSLDSIGLLVKKAGLPIAIQGAINTQLKYQYASGLANSLANKLNTRTNRADFNLKYIDAVLTNFTVPQKQELEISAAANYYLDAYMKLKLWKGMYQYRTDKDTIHAAAIFKKDMGVVYADLANDPDRTNEVYLFGTRLKTIVPAYAWEKHLTNLLYRFCMQGQLQTATKMMRFIKNNCEDKQYILVSEKMFAPLKQQRDQYANNLNIKIRADYRTTSTVKDMVAPYKGKVVFVDMWGTWCPYCISDMEFEPALKERLKDKEVVFLYIARDEDEDDEKWRDFIFINNLTGEHIRRNSDQISSVWNEFGIPDNEQAYPRYLIFDKDGKLVEKNAKRPTDKAGLAVQIEKYL